MTALGQDRAAHAEVALAGASAGEPGRRTYAGFYRAGIIGHSGRGDYGHGLDNTCVGMPRVEIRAVADADDAGRARVTARTGAARGYADYRQMLEREALDLVVVATRWPDQHEAMICAAAAAGVKAIYCEKPLARSLAEADRMLAACSAHDVKLAVAHPNRIVPTFQRAAQLVAEGAIGRLRVMRAFGKLDHRGGGQDMLVLGIHRLDLMRFFAGEARWCHARVCADGRDVTPGDVRWGDEEIGPVAGDDVIAQYGFDSGVTGTFESMRSADGGGARYFRIELCGTGGVLALWGAADSPILHISRPTALPDGSSEWVALPASASEAQGGRSEPRHHLENQALVSDLLFAVEQDREPVSSGAGAREAIEMVMAVYESQIRQGRVELPLSERTHPLERWLQRTGAPGGMLRNWPPVERL